MSKELIFIKLYRTASSNWQVLIKGESDVKKLSKDIKRGDLIEVFGSLTGKKNLRGEIEIKFENYKILNDTKELPFESEDKANISEETKYKYRYLDFRRPSVSNILNLKSKFFFEIRKFFFERNFIEVETPILSPYSPEGANCFLVNSKFNERYYTLSQSAQIFKQLLMIGSIDKYFSITKSFRNEDSRSNRQIEFSQLELEMSFISLEDLMEIVEKFMESTLKKTFGIKIETPFSRINFEDNKNNNNNSSFFSKEKKLNFLWIKNWPAFEYDKEKKQYVSARHPFTLPKREYVELLLEKKIDPLKVTCEAVDLLCNGEEILSGSLRIYTRNLQERILEILGYDEKKKEIFKYFLNALEFAAPPHGGFGLGIDRLLSKILNLKSIKEVIAFPKNSDGTCPLTKAPNFFT